jgi:5-deoxy-5-amino-3-dehydroquinate synthase
VAEHQEVVDHYGLPSAVPIGVATADLIGLMRQDKKAIGGMAFTLDGPGGPGLVRDVPEDAVARVLERMPRQALEDLIRP